MTISQPVRRNRANTGQHGYILLTLMLFVALMAIAAIAIVPTVTFQIRRDREEEMIHRGVQYSRAVRRYFKKFGRFPTRLEELENTNNLRFLRKRYKDPVTGKDFNVLHMGDVKLSFGAGIVGANPAGVPTLGGAAAVQNAVAIQPALAAAAAGALANAQPAPNLNASQAPGDNSSANALGTNAENSASGNSATSGTSSLSGFSGATFGGGPIVGVASTSKKESIREFNKKNHYNDWQFIYDPGSDRGGLLNTPAQPPLQNAAQGLQPAVPGGTVPAIQVQPAAPGQPPTQVQPAPQ